VTDKVADASALAALLFYEPRRLEAETRLEDASLHAPTLVDYELANVCLKKIRQRAAEADKLLTAFGELDNLPLTRHEVDFLDTIGLAQRKNISLHDASYLWLARRLGVELVTFDEKLERAAAKP
jgi:predicted nucleic acid-binding protein